MADTYQSNGVKYNGETGEIEGDEEKSATITVQASPEGVESLARAANGIASRPRQTSMLVRHPEMDEHAELVQKTVRELADQFPEGAEISLGVKVPFEFMTADYQQMDAKITIKVDVKPHKEKEEK